MWPSARLLRVPPGVAFFLLFKNSLPGLAWCGIEMTGPRLHLQYHGLEFWMLSSSSSSPSFASVKMMIRVLVGKCGVLRVNVVLMFANFGLLELSARIVWTFVSSWILNLVMCDLGLVLM